MDNRGTTRREILYGYDDAGNLKSEQRTGVDFDRRDENVRYTYDSANQLTQTTVEGVTAKYQYDLAGNLLDDGKYTYTYDLQNRLLTKAGTDGTTTYTYDAAGNLLKKTAPDGLSTYEYTAQNKLKKGTNPRGETSEYSYNALGIRVKNVQTRGNANFRYANALLNNGSRFMKDYMAALSDGRNTWQPTWETEVGTTVQNATEKVTKNYVVDYLSVANRDIMVESEGQYTQRNVYDENSRRISAEFDYAEDTKRGEPGENIASDTAVNELGKVWYRTSLLGSTLFAVDETGEVITHAIYDPWGNPLTETKTDLNFSGMDNLNNFTGYTWDETLGLYFAQNRFYDAENHRFTQEDPVKDGANWYSYGGNNPVNTVDPMGLMNYFTQTDNLLSGVWRGIKDNTVGLIESLPQAIPMLKELIKGVAGGQINIVDLMKALLSSAVADYWHVIRYFGTLSPFQKNTDAEVYRYGQAVGRVGTEIVLSMVGANIANKALKLLKGSAVGKKIVALANQAKGAFQNYSCKAVNSLNNVLDDIVDTGGDVAKALTAGAKKNVLFKADEAVTHFGRHAKELMDALGKKSYTLKQYIEDANYVLRNGQYVPELNGYIRLIGGAGRAKYGFVGLDRLTGEITTFHIKQVSELIKNAPSLGLGR